MSKLFKAKEASPAAGSAAVLPAVPVPGQAYRYTQEIAQMMFVAGEIQDPLGETVRYIEDVVRGQVIELAIRARLLAHRRASRNLAPEDLIFLIRDDRAKVNRLRTYLSWKDVRKNAKDTDGPGGSSGGPGGGNGPGGGPGGEDDAGEGEDKLATKSRRQVIKLPWEVTTYYSNFLAGHAAKRRRLASATGAPVQDDDDADDEDEDDMEANEDLLKRLRDADILTRDMTREEYAHYSECRQASFTFKKGKRFREFINFSAYLDAKPNDEIIDIFGFLCYEMVHTLTTAALALRASLSSSSSLSSTADETLSPKKRTRTESSPELAICSLFQPPAEARAPLSKDLVKEAFARIVRAKMEEGSRGLGAWRADRGGVLGGKSRLPLL